MHGPSAAAEVAGFKGSCDSRDFHCHYSTEEALGIAKEEL